MVTANLPGAIFRYRRGPDGADEILYISSGCQPLWEVQADAIRADVSLLWRMVNPGDLAAMKASLAASAKTLSLWTWVWRINTPSRTEKWLQGIAQPAAEANGYVVWDGVVIDAKSKQAEYAQSSSEHRLRAIIEAEPECVKVLDLDGTIQDMNPAGLALLEADSLHQVVGKPVTDFLQPDCRQPFEAMGQRVLQGATEQMEFGLCGLKGTQRWVDRYRLPLGAIKLTRLPIAFATTRAITFGLKPSPEGLPTKPDRRCSF